MSFVVSHSTPPLLSQHFSSSDDSCVRVIKVISLIPTKVLNNNDKCSSRSQMLLALCNHTQHYCVCDWHNQSNIKNFHHFGGINDLEPSFNASSSFAAFLRMRRDLCNSTYRRSLLTQPEQHVENFHHFGGINDLGSRAFLPSFNVSSSFTAFLRMTHELHN